MNETQEDTGSNSRQSEQQIEGCWAGRNDKAIFEEQKGQCGQSKMDQGSLITEEEVTRTWSFRIRQASKMFHFYCKCDGETVEQFKQVNDILCFTC